MKRKSNDNLSIAGRHPLPHSPQLGFFSHLLKTKAIQLNYKWPPLGLVTITIYNHQYVQQSQYNRQYVEDTEIRKYQRLEFDRIEEHLNQQLTHFLRKYPY